jgi:hypothetical protein
VTHDGGQGTPGQLGDPAEIEPEGQRQETVEPVHVEESEAERRDGDGRRARQPLRQTRLHVAAEERLLGGPRHQPHDEHGEQQVGADRLGERAANRHHAAVVREAHEGDQRVERLTEC